MPGESAPNTERGAVIGSGWGVVDGIPISPSHALLEKWRIQAFDMTMLRVVRAQGARQVSTNVPIIAMIKLGGVVRTRAAYTIYPATTSLIIDSIGKSRDARGGREGRKWRIIDKSASVV